ncbi:MAG: hypothetical protein U0166_05535 [Acidobacteriota bacterium]
MAKRIEPIRKTPEEHLDDLLAGHRDATFREEGAKYVRRAIGSSSSLPNAVKFFAYALLAADSPDEEEALDALRQAEGYVEVAREQLGRRFGKELSTLRFLERGITLRSERAEIEEAIRLCDLAIDLGLGIVYERKRASLERLTS